MIPGGPLTSRKFQSLDRIVSRVKAISRWHIENRILRLYLRPEYSGKVAREGNWIVPEEILGSSSICYCAGVGEDLDFELMLVSRFDANVYAFDPTPRAIQFVRKIVSGAGKLQFLPLGVWSRDETLRFYAPENPEHVSHSVVASTSSRSYFDAPCRRISTLMSEHGHNKIDLLKMNIEGAEYEVLQSLLSDKLYPRAICLTFEGSSALRQAILWTRRLRLCGYQLAGLQQWAATFVRLSAS